MPGCIAEKRARKGHPKCASHDQSTIDLAHSLGLRFRRKLLTGLLAGLIVSGLGADPAIGQTASPPYELNPALLDLPVGRWAKIHQQRFSDAVTFNRQRHGGSAFDSRRGRIVLFGSDTHEDKTWLNSPLFFDLGTLEWQQLYPTDPLSSYRVNADGLPVAGPNGDHPWAMHTFGAMTYDLNADAIVVSSYPEHMEPGRFMYSLKSLWSQVKRHPTWILKLGSGKWEALPGDPTHFFVHATARDARRGVILGYRFDGIHELTLATGQWHQVAEPGLLGSGNNVVFDSRNNALIAFGGKGQPNDVVAFKPETGEHKKMATPGIRPPGGRYVPLAYHSGLAQTIAIIDRPPESGSDRRLPHRADTWLYDHVHDAWTRLDAAELPFAVGMNFNLEYDPGHQLLLLVATPNDQPLPAVWALKLQNATQQLLSEDVERSARLDAQQTITEATDIRPRRVCPPGSQSADCEFHSIAQALEAAQDGDMIVIEPGVFEEAAIVHANNLTILAKPGAHMKGVAAEGKAALVVKGDDVVIEGLECSAIWVSHGNGACIRAEGTNLTLRRVYFHDSQEGILGGRGRVVIEDSVFERLGGDEIIHLGQAHAIYIIDKVDELIVRGNRILSSKEEGHEVKSRAKRTVIENNVIASLEGKDSRLIDIPIGGTTIIRNNILQEGLNSSNPDLIGIGLERGRSPEKDHATSSTVIEGNTIIIDQKQRTSLINTRNVPPAVVSGNIIIGGLPFPSNRNRWFKDRREAGLAPYPALRRWTEPAGSRASTRVRTSRFDNVVETPGARNFGRRGKLSLRPETSEAIWKGTPVQLTPQEFRVLALMHDNSNKVMPGEDLYAALTDGPAKADEATQREETKRLIVALRRKFRAVDSVFTSIVAYPNQGFGWRE